ncbi:MAG: hypothetical protein AB2792_05585 [Candidatus Thiodiazotropha sp.]
MKQIKWVAILTGSKNTLKGAGFFLGGLLLYVTGFRWAMEGMAAVPIRWMPSGYCLQLKRLDFGRKLGRNNRKRRVFGQTLGACRLRWRIEWHQWGRRQHNDSSGCNPT